VFSQRSLRQSCRHRGADQTLKFHTPRRSLRFRFPNHPHQNSACHRRTSSRPFFQISAPHRAIRSTPPMGLRSSLQLLERFLSSYSSPTICPPPRTAVSQGGWPSVSSFPKTGPSRIPCSSQPIPRGSSIGRASLPSGDHDSTERQSLVSRSQEGAQCSCTIIPSALSMLQSLLVSSRSSAPTLRLLR